MHGDSYGGFKKGAVLGSVGFTSGTRSGDHKRENVGLTGGDY